MAHESDFETHPIGTGARLAAEREKNAKLQELFKSEAVLTQERDAALALVKRLCHAAALEEEAKTRDVTISDGRVFHVHAATRAQITSALRAALTPKEPSHDFRTVLLDRAVAAEKAAKVALATEREKREAAEKRIEQFQLGSQGRQGWSAWAWGGKR